MRHIILLLALSCGFSANAATATKETLEKCTNISKLAETVMKKRQEGVAMSDLMKVANDGAEPNQFLVGMITAAYEESRYNGEEMKQRKVEDFRDQFYLGCVQRFKD